MWKRLARLSDIIRQQLRSKLQQRFRISFPASTVARFACDGMLDVNLDDADTVKLTMLEITQFVDTVGFATGDCHEERRWKIMGRRLLLEFLRELCMTQAV